MHPQHSYDHPADRIDPRHRAKRRPSQRPRAAAARRARIAQRIALEELWHEIVAAHSAQPR